MGTQTRRSIPVAAISCVIAFLAGWYGPGAPVSAAQDTATTQSFQAYSKFDFVPGEKIVALEDFSQDTIGDFLARWNTDGSGEVVTLASLLPSSSPVCPTTSRWSSTSRCHPRSRGQRSSWP